MFPCPLPCDLNKLCTVEEKLSLSECVLKFEKEQQDQS